MTASAQGCAGRRKITKALRSRIKSHIIKKNHDSRNRKPPEAYSGNHERRSRVLLWEKSAQPLGRDSNTDSELKKGSVSSSSERRTGRSGGQQGHSPRKSSTTIGKSQTPIDTRRRHVPHRRPTSTWRRASSDASCGRTSSGWIVTTAFSQLVD